MKYSDLQYCVSFRCTVKEFRYIHLLFFSGYFPLYVITKYLILFSMLYSKFLLLIYFIYSSVYLLILYPNLPLSTCLSPLVTNNLFSVSVSLFLFYYSHLLALYFYIPHGSDNIQYIAFSFWHSEMLIIIPSRSIKVVSNGIISFFLWLSIISLYIYTISSLFIHLLMDF